VILTEIMISTDLGSSSKYSSEEKENEGKTLWSKLI